MLTTDLFSLSCLWGLRGSLVKYSLPRIRSGGSLLGARSGVFRSVRRYFTEKSSGQTLLINPHASAGSSPCLERRARWSRAH